LGDGLVGDAQKNGGISDCEALVPNEERRHILLALGHSSGRGGVAGFGLIELVHGRALRLGEVRDYLDVEAGDVLLSQLDD